MATPSVHCDLRSRATQTDVYLAQLLSLMSAMSNQDGKTPSLDDTSARYQLPASLSLSLPGNQRLSVLDTLYLVITIHCSLCSVLQTRSLNGVWVTSLN